MSYGFAFPIIPYPGEPVPCSGTLTKLRVNFSSTYTGYQFGVKVFQRISTSNPTVKREYTEEYVVMLCHNLESKDNDYIPKINMISQISIFWGILT